MTTRRISVGLVAITLAACGVAGAATMPGGAPADAAPQAGTLACALVITEGRGMVSLAAQVRSPVAVSGSYALSVGRGGGDGSATIDQGGGFTARAGETLTLGRIDMNGRARDLSTAFTIEARGQRLTCPLSASF
jgi:hypothetical protein